MKLGHIAIPDHNVVGSYLEVFQLPEMQGVVYMTSCIKQVCCTAGKQGKVGTLFLPISTRVEEHRGRCAHGRYWPKATFGKEARFGSCILISEGNACCLTTHTVSGLLDSLLRGR